MMGEGGGGEGGGRGGGGSGEGMGGGWEDEEASGCRKLRTLCLGYVI